MSNDLYNMPPGTKEILQNKEIIAVSQDPLGKMVTIFWLTVSS